MCTDELKRRLPIDFKGVSYGLLLSRTKLLTDTFMYCQMLVKVIDKDGIREVEYDDSKQIITP